MVIPHLSTCLGNEVFHRNKATYPLFMMQHFLKILPVTEKTLKVKCTLSLQKTKTKKKQGMLLNISLVFTDAET